MANPNDNSELFEIFQNKVDLEEEQEKEAEEEESEEKERNEDDYEEADEGNKGSQEKQQKEPNENEQTREPQDEPEERIVEDTGGSTTEKKSPLEPAPSQQDVNQAQKPEQPQTPSSSVAPEDPENPDTETGSYIRQLEEEKELEGKIILSRGASVMLLMLAIFAVIGAYFIGLQTNPNQPPLTTDQTTSSGVEDRMDHTGKNAAGVTTDDEQAQKTGSQKTESNGSESSNVIAQNQTFYTVALIAFPSGQDDINEILKKHMDTIRNEAGLNYVDHLVNPQGNNRHWIVVGYFKDRETAKKKADQMRPRLNKTRHGNQYRTDILEITPEQARKIKAR